MTGGETGCSTADTAASHRPSDRRIGSYMDQEGFLTIEQVARYLNMKVKTVYAKASEIPHYRVGRLLRFRKEDIDHWMEAQRKEAGAQSTGHKPRSGRAHAVDGIVKRAIDEVLGTGYTSLSGKSDRIKGLGKER
jgi:excisionase family DNA binding protein